MKRPDLAKLRAKRKLQLEAQRTRLRARMERQRTLAQARIAALKSKHGKKEEPRNGRRTLLLMLLVALLLLLLQTCCCQGLLPGMPDPVVPVEVEPEPEPEPEPKPPTGRIKRRKRPAFKNQKPKPLPWLASFRLQVAARGPRLSACFVGAEGPGTLKWTTSVEPSEGRVSDHTLEPTLVSVDLSKKEKKCVLGVLSAPPYKLDPGSAPSTPSRVGLVIEF